MIAGSLTLLSACSTPEPGSPEAIAKAAEEKREARIEQVEDTVDDMPNWFLNPPKDDAISIYGAGSAVSNDVQLGVDKAVLNAKRALADRLQSKISSQLKAYISETGDEENPSVANQIESVTTNVITEVDVSGYQREETEVLTQEGKYRLFVLLRYPLATANRILVEKIKENKTVETRLRASKAFQELEEEIKRAAPAK